jgi:hypothetical protein
LFFKPFLLSADDSAAFGYQLEAAKAPAAPLVINHRLK